MFFTGQCSNMNNSKYTEYKVYIVKTYLLNNQAPCVRWDNYEEIFSVSEKSKLRHDEE